MSEQTTTETNEPDWWQMAFTKGATCNGLVPTLWQARQFERGLAAALPVVLAELTRRIEAERVANTPPDSRWRVGVHDGLDHALTVVAGLAGEVGQHD